MPLQPRKGSTIPARLLDFNGLSRVPTITGPISLDSKGRTGFYGGDSRYLGSFNSVWPSFTYELWTAGLACVTSVSGEVLNVFHY